MFDFDEALRERIARNLKAFPVNADPNDDLRHAAVALVVVGHPETGEASLLLTLRPLTLNRHGGQYALPGGRVDEGETDEQAVLRELDEELGLALDPGAIIGLLDDYRTRSGFRMAPFVMWGGAPASLTPDPVEVEQVFHIPLSELENPDIPILLPPNSSGRQVMKAYLPSLGHLISAPTAAILYQFREVALHGRATRVAHFDQPEFARR